MRTRTTMEPADLKSRLWAVERQKTSSESEARQGQSQPSARERTLKRASVAQKTEGEGCE